MIRVLFLIAALGGAPVPGVPQASSLPGAIDQLVSFDYPTRMNAARVLRRAPVADVMPALIKAVREHPDSYVRYRSLVLVAGVGGPAAGELMRTLIADPNDRVRAVVYAWFEHAPDPAVVAQLVSALEREQSEFVRPALTRALAAAHSVQAAREAVTPLILRGEDFFRGSVIEALGDHGARWALPQIEQVARLDGPLQDDAITAVGKLGDRSSMAVLAALQKGAPPETQPALAAATCLITRECAPQEDYLIKTLAFAAVDPARQPLLRATAFALASLGARGRVSALQALLDAAGAAAEPARAALVLAVGHVALRSPATVLAALEARPSRDRAITALRDAFDMLNEDFEEERFFVEVRRAYWAAADGSAQRAVALALIEQLEF